MDYSVHPTHDSHSNRGVCRVVHSISATFSKVHMEVNPITVVGITINVENSIVITAIVFSQRNRCPRVIRRRFNFECYSNCSTISCVNRKTSSGRRIQPRAFISHSSSRSHVRRITLRKKCILFIRKRKQK